MIPNSNAPFPFTLSVPSSFRMLWLFLILSVFSWVSGSGAYAQTMDNRAFAAALAHINQEEWPQAEGLLKFLLSENPAMHRARLELAMVYVQMAQHQKAKAQFETLLSINEVPAPVKHNIRQQLLQLSKPPGKDTQQAKPLNADANGNANRGASSHKTNGSVQLSVGYDDNVRFSSADYFLEEDPLLDGLFLELDDGELIYIAPDGLAYDIDGNPLLGDDLPDDDLFVDFATLGLAQQDRENRFIEAKLNLHHQYQFATTPDLTWHNKLSLQTTENQQHSAYNKTQMRLETGLSQRLSDQWTWTVVAHHRLLERDGQVQIRAWSVNPELTYYNDWGSWTLGLEWMNREYEDSLIVSGDIETFYYGFSSTIRSISGKWSKLFWHNDLLLLAQLEYSDNNADDDFNYQGTHITLASVYDFQTHWSLLLSASYFNQDYSEVGDGPLDDKSRTLRGKLTYSVNDATELFLAGERAIRTSDVYGGIKSDKSLMQVGVELAF